MVILIVIWLIMRAKYRQIFALSTIKPIFHAIINTEPRTKRKKMPKTTVRHRDNAAKVEDFCEKAEEPKFATQIFKTKNSNKKQKPRFFFFIPRLNPTRQVSPKGEGEELRSTTPDQTLPHQYQKLDP